MFESGMSLGKRLTISFTVIIAFMAVLAILTSSRIAALNTAIGAIVNDRYPKTNIANRVKAASATHSMHNEADNLSNAISAFKLGDDGNQNHIADVQAIGHDA